MNRSILSVFVCVILLCSLLLSCAAETTVFGVNEMTEYISGLVADVQPGTAGASLKATRKCAELMRADIAFDVTGADIADCVRGIVETLDAEGVSELCEAASMLRNACECLTIGDPLPMLSDAGCEEDTFVTDPAAIGVIYMIEASVTNCADRF